MKDFYDSRSDINNQVNELMHGASLIQLYHQEKTVLSEFNATARKMSQADKQIVWVSALSSWPLTEFLKNTVLAVILTIVGQQCLMAKTRFRGREWTVWYAPEVGIPLGPWKLAGLPGLILKAHCENYMDLEANSLQTKGVPPVMFYNFYNHKYTLIAREKYLKASTDPKTYPPKTIIAPPMELE